MNEFELILAILEELHQRIAKLEFDPDVQATRELLDRLSKVIPK